MNKPDSIKSGASKNAASALTLILLVLCAIGPLVFFLRWVQIFPQVLRILNAKRLGYGEVDDDTCNEILSTERRLCYVNMLALVWLAACPLVAAYDIYIQKQGTSEIVILGIAYLCALGLVQYFVFSFTAFFIKNVGKEYRDGEIRYRSGTVPYWGVCCVATAIFYVNDWQEQLPIKIAGMEQEIVILNQQIKEEKDKLVKLVDERYVNYIEPQQPEHQVALAKQARELFEAVGIVGLRKYEESVFAEREQLRKRNNALGRRINQIEEDERQRRAVELYRSTVKPR